MSVLDKLWHKFMPGTKEEFCLFLGATEAALDTMTFSDLEKLPRLKGHIQPLGGRPRPRNRVAFDWKVLHNSRNLNRGEIIVGFGDDYNEAALHGIMVLYELGYRRNRGSFKTLGRRAPERRQVKPDEKGKRRSAKCRSSSTRRQRGGTSVTSAENTKR